MEIRPFDFVKEADAFCQLYRTVYGKPVDGNYVKWKFIDDPAGPAFGYGAWEGKTLVGFVALTPYLFTGNGKKMMASQGADTMVLREHRGRGLFAKMTGILLAEMNKRQWHFRYSAPGKLSYSGYIKKLGHKNLTNLPYWVKIRPLNYVKHKMDITPEEEKSPVDIMANNGHEVLPVAEFGTEHDSFWEMLNATVTFGIIKNAEYLNWRYARHPLHRHDILECRTEGRLSGYAVLRGGNLLELSALGESSRDLLLKASEIIWDRSNCIMSHGWFMGDEAIEDALKNNGWLNYGFKIRPFGLYPAQPLIYYPNPNLIDQMSTFTSGQWRFSMGDIDCM